VVILAVSARMRSGSPNSFDRILEQRFVTFPSDLTPLLACRFQSALHLFRSCETVRAVCCTGFEEELRDCIAQFWPDRPRIYHLLSHHRPRARVGMVTIAQQLIEHHTDSKQIGGDIPPGQVDIRRLIRRRTRLRVHGIADAGSDVEIQELLQLTVSRRPVPYQNSQPTLSWRFRCR
jgi:hypothetical protein